MIAHLKTIGVMIAVASLLGLVYKYPYQSALALVIIFLIVLVGIFYFYILWWFK